MRRFREWQSPLPLNELRQPSMATPRYWGSGFGVLRGTGLRGGMQLWFVKGTTWTDVTPAERRVGSGLYSYGAISWSPWSAKKALAIMVDRGTMAIVHRERGILREFPLDGMAQGFPVRWSQHEFAYVADFGPQRGRAIVVVDVETGLSRHVYETPKLIGDLCVERHEGLIAWVEWESGSLPWESARAQLAHRSYLRLWPDEVPTPGGAAANLTFDGPTLHGVCEVNDRFVPFRFRDGEVRTVSTFVGEGRSDWFFGWRWTAHGTRHTTHVSLHDATTTLVQIADDDAVSVVEDAPLAIQEIDGRPGRIIVLGSAGDSESSLYEFRDETKKWRRRRAPGSPRNAHPASLGEVRTTDSGVTFVYFEPHHPQVVAPPDDRPGLILHIHGGPTATAGRGYRFDTHLFTTSGFAVASVEYTGSTGYGAAFRRGLYGRYGDVDVRDVLDVASYLVARGEVDPSKVFVRGGSSGGMTALLCAEDPRITGAIAAYPVTDMLQLHEATHEAEGGYLEDLVGPLPEAKDRFRRLSPRYRERAPRRVLILQGDSDPVVPATLVRDYVDYLRLRGVEVEYLEFVGEGHGFRQADTRRRVAEAELRFLRS